MYCLVGNTVCILIYSVALLRIIKTYYYNVVVF